MQLTGLVSRVVISSSVSIHAHWPAFSPSVTSNFHSHLSNGSNAFPVLREIPPSLCLTATSTSLARYAVPASRGHLASSLLDALGIHFSLLGWESGGSGGGLEALEARLAEVGVVREPSDLQLRAVLEAPPGAAPTRLRFLTRNRIIAALGVGTVVVEGAVRSGALSTAEWARTLRRPLMGMPGPITSAPSQGVHQLLRLGHARLVAGPEDVLEDLHKARKF
jgi:hypothetical protein